MLSCWKTRIKQTFTSELHTGTNILYNSLLSLYNWTELQGTIHLVHRLKIMSSLFLNKCCLWGFLELKQTMTAFLMSLREEIFLCRLSIGSKCLTYAKTYMNREDPPWNSPDCWKHSHVWFPHGTWDLGTVAFLDVSTKRWVIVKPVSNHYSCSKRCNLIESVF